MKGERWDRQEGVSGQLGMGMERAGHATSVRLSLLPVAPTHTHSSHSPPSLTLVPRFILPTAFTTQE